VATTITLGAEQAPSLSTFRRASIAGYRTYRVTVRQVFLDRQLSGAGTVGAPVATSSSKLTDVVEKVSGLIDGVVVIGWQAISPGLVAVPAAGKLDTNATGSSTPRSRRTP